MAIELGKPIYEYYQLVQVTWVDVKSGAEWQSIDDYKKTDVPIVHSVGYLIEETPTVLKLAATVCVEDGDCSDTIRIPRGCIIFVEKMGKSSGTA